MDPNETYSVRAFARLAGVTVRALHHYDQVGLLRPRRVGRARYRRYAREDLLRLQQILTLKYLGFSLDEIRRILTDPGYDVRESLRLQKRAVDQRIIELREVARAIEATLEKLGQQGAELDYEQVLRVIQAMVGGGPGHWARQHFTPEQLARVAERHGPLTPEQVDEWARQWEDLGQAFAALQDRDPADPEVQALAARVEALGQAFTGGDREIEASLRAMYADAETIPGAWGPRDPALYAFIGRALEVYRAR